MSDEPGPDIPVTMTTGEVRVGKAFEADRFPVPAIAFEVESLADEPIRIRLVDDIPESFPMEGVGFHPDYEGDNWTAYRDNRVAYERTLDPGESVLTVYGIRIDDPNEADDFLDDPEIELIEHGEAAATGDVLGRETTQVVRDALSGDESSDLGDLEAGSLLDEDDTPAPRDRNPDAVSVVGPRDESVTPIDTDSDDEDADDDAPDAVPSAAAADALDPRSGADDGAAAELEPEPEPDPDSEDGTGTTDDAGAAGSSTPAPSDSIAATLAAEIRAGTVDDDDLAVLQEAFGGEVPTSVDVRVGRLQSQIEDLLAYRDALADFLDENGTAEEVVGEVSEELHDLTDRVDSLEASLAEADDDRAAIREEVSSLTDRVGDVDDRIGTVETELDDLQSTAETLDERLDAVEELESDIEDIEAELDDLRDFRDRLSSAFGTGEE
jgi:archaellum component FlaC